MSIRDCSPCAGSGLGCQPPGHVNQQSHHRGDLRRKNGILKHAGQLRTKGLDLTGVLTRRPRRSSAPPSPSMRRAGRTQSSSSRSASSAPAARRRTRPANSSWWIFPSAQAAKRSLLLVEAGTFIRKQLGQGGADKTQEAGIRLVADLDVVEAEQVLPLCAVSQILIDDVIELLEGLMEDYDTLAEDNESIEDEGRASPGQDVRSEGYAAWAGQAAGEQCRPCYARLFATWSARAQCRTEKHPSFRESLIPEWGLVIILPREEAPRPARRGP